MKFFSLFLFFFLAAALNVYPNSDSAFVLIPGWQKDQAKKINYCYTVKDSSGIRLNSRLLSEVTVWETDKNGCILYWKILNRSLSGHRAKLPTYIDLSKMESFPCIYKIKMNADGSLDSFFNLPDVMGTYAINTIVKESLPEATITDSSFADSVSGELQGIIQEEVKAIQIYLKSYNVRYDNHEGQKVRYPVPGRCDSLFFTIDTHFYEDLNYLNTDFRIYMTDLQKTKGIEFSKNLPPKQQEELLNAINMESYHYNVIEKETNWIVKKVVTIKTTGMDINAEYTIE